MGLPRPALRFLAREHKRKAFAQPVLSLGRQGVLATHDEAVGILREEGLTPVMPLPGESLGTNIPSWKGTWNERLTSDVAFFRLLGVRDFAAMDVSDYEKPDFIADLNQPVPSELEDRFGTVLDVGTLEHVFDPLRALSNVGRMLKTGGRVVHVLPVNNYVNHGFYQFSPTVFFDYYKANGFTGLRGWLVEESHRLDAWDLYELPEDRYAQFPEFVSAERLSILFTAEKAAGSTTGRVPSQGRYERDYAAPPGPAAPLDERAGLRRLLPAGAEAFLRRWALPYDPANRLPLRLKTALMTAVPFFDKRREAWRRRLKPWGLTRVGTLD
jgi:SAM-dependent methyltransferase